MPKSDGGKVRWPYPTRKPVKPQKLSIFHAVGGKQPKGMPKVGSMPNWASTFKDNNAN